MRGRGDYSRVLTVSTHAGHMAGLNRITSSLVSLSMLGVIMDVLTVSTQAGHMTGLNSVTPSLVSLSMLGVFIAGYCW